VAPRRGFRGIIRHHGLLSHAVTPLTNNFDTSRGSYQRRRDLVGLRESSPQALVISRSATIVVDLNCDGATYPYSTFSDLVSVERGASVPQEEPRSVPAKIRIGLSIGSYFLKVCDY